MQLLAAGLSGGVAAGQAASGRTGYDNVLAPPHDARSDAENSLRVELVNAAASAFTPGAQ
jgi:hypothetical protein